MKSKRQKHLWACFVFILTVMLTATSVSAQTDDPALHDAKKYAEIHGITVEEALRRFSVQTSVGEPAHLMEVNEADTFSGFWIEHLPEFKLVAAFTIDPGISHDLVDKYFPESTASGIEIRQYEFTLVELQAIQSQTMSLLKSAGIEWSSSGLDVMKNRVEIMVPDLVKFNESIQAKKLMLHPSVHIIEGIITLDILGPSANNWVFLLIIGVPAIILSFFGWRLFRKR